MNKNSFSKWITLSINTIVFLVVQYILGCATFSFQHHPIFILFFASEMYILTRYLNFLIDTLSKKSLAYTIFIVTFLLLLCLFLFIGILPISKVSLQRHNHKSQQKPSQPTLKRRCFFVKSDVFLWPGFRKEWC